MSSRSHDIIDLKEKITLLLRHKVNGIETQTELAEGSGIDKAVINRWLNPTKVGLRDFEKLCDVHKNIVPSELWDKPVEEFADALGLTYEAPQRTLSNPAILAEKVGIDFESRIKDRAFLERRFEVMKGYWEIISYAISETGQKSLNYTLLQIGNLNSNGYIECYESGTQFDYHGYCFFVSGSTYFIMEEMNLLHELVFCITNSPYTSSNPMLSGIYLALTGGGRELVAIPSAVRIVLHHIGCFDAIKEKYKLDASLTSEKEIISTVRRIINTDHSQVKDILPLIDNHIPQDAVPYALRAKLF